MQPNSNVRDKYTRIYSKENIEKFKQYLKNERNWTKFMEEDDCNNATEEYLKINKEAHDTTN